MANINQINGARIVGHLSGSPYIGKARLYGVPATDATALYVGDIVKGVVGFTDMGATYTTSDRYLPTITQSAATNVPIGVVVGFVVYPDNLTLTYRLASTLRGVLVADDPSVIFEMQSDGTGVATDCGKLCDLAVGSPSTLFGTSGMYISHATIGSGQAIRIIGISSSVNSQELGSYTKYLCTFAKHQLAYAANVGGLS